MFCGARFPSRASTRPPHRISRHVQRGGRDCQWIVRDITNSAQKCFVVRGSPLAHLRDLHIESLGMYKGEEEILGEMFCGARFPSRASTRPPHRISRHVQRGGRDCQWIVRDITNSVQKCFVVRGSPSRASTRPPHRISRHVQRGGRDSRWFVRDLTNSVQKCFVVRGSPLAHLRNLHIESLGMHKGEEGIVSGLPPHRISRHVQRGGRDSRWFVRDLTNSVQKRFVVRGSPLAHLRDLHIESLGMYKGEAEIVSGLPPHRISRHVQRGGRDSRWIVRDITNSVQKCFVVLWTKWIRILHVNINGGMNIKRDHRVNIGHSVCCVIVLVS
ncbi:hypothetical protein J6590_089356 [Homalodisca vitripennis]|nr:hypothetical protein J6590_089356 [Homalodisca vitripennis]